MGLLPRLTRKERTFEKHHFLFCVKKIKLKSQTCLEVEQNQRLRVLEPWLKWMTQICTLILILNFIIFLLPHFIFYVLRLCTRKKSQWTKKRNSYYNVYDWLIEWNLFVPLIWMCEKKISTLQQRVTLFESLWNDNVQ